MEMETKTKTKRWRQRRRRRRRYHQPCSNVADSVRVDSGGRLGGTDGGRIHLDGGGTNLKGGSGLMWHHPGGGGVESGEGHSKLPPCHIHCIPHRSP